MNFTVARAELMLLGTAPGGLVLIVETKLGDVTVHVILTEEATEAALEFLCFKRFGMVPLSNSILQIILSFHPEKSN